MESENNKEFDRQIKAKLDELQPEVPASLWDSIAKELPREEKERKISGKTRFPYSWAAIAACLLIAFSFWKLQPKEVIHLRSTAAIAENEMPDDIVALQDGATTESAPIADPVSPAFPLARRSEPAVAGSDKSTSSLLSDVSPNSYASVNRTEIPSHQQIEALELPEPDFINEPKVQSVLEEEVAFAPAPFEEASTSDYPGADAQDISVEERSRPKVVSSVLNFIAGNIQIGSGGTRVEFSETEHGVLKVDIKGFLNKNNQGL